MVLELMERRNIGINSWPSYYYYRTSRAGGISIYLRTFVELQFLRYKVIQLKARADRACRLERDLKLERIERVDSSEG